MNKNNGKGSTDQAREKALQVLVQVETKKAFLHLALKNNLGSSLRKEDRSFATRMSYGVIQHLNTLDWVLSLNLKKGIGQLTPWIRNILRLSAYQLFYLDKVPSHAIVDESVKLAYRYGHKGVAGLVNAVLRKTNRYTWEALPWPDKYKEPVNYLSLRYSFPRWLINRWMESFTFTEVENVCCYHNLIPPVTIRTNTNIIDSYSLKEHLTNEKTTVKEHSILPDTFQVENSPFPLDRLKAYKEGFFHIQGDSSIVTCHALNPQKGDKVLDLCASPGGKTATLSQLMQGKGEIVAVEPEAKRMQLLRNSVHRLQLENVTLAQLDGRDISSSSWGKFDKVLVDAPCSGMGVIRRKPDIKWRLNKSFFGQISSLQASLINEGLEVLAPGGLLVYAVCSTDIEETIKPVNSILNNNPNVSLAKLETPIGLEPWKGRHGLYFIHPHQYGFDGFFMAGLAIKPFN